METHAEGHYEITLTAKYTQRERGYAIGYNTAVTSLALSLCALRYDGHQPGRCNGLLPEENAGKAPEHDTDGPSDTCPNPSPHMKHTYKNDPNNDVLPSVSNTHDINPLQKGR